MLCGSLPHLATMASGRLALRMHAFGVDGPISSFASFHSVHCAHGFIYFNSLVRQSVCVRRALHADSLHVFPNIPY